MTKGTTRRYIETRWPIQQNSYWVMHVTISSALCIYTSSPQRLALLSLSRHRGCEDDRKKLIRALEKAAMAIVNSGDHLGPAPPIAGPSKITLQTHSHRHRPLPRPRSHSRSSSSPSPPPAPLIKPHAQAHSSLREKRRSFGARHSPLPRGRTFSASDRGDRDSNRDRLRESGRVLEQVRGRPASVSSAVFQQESLDGGAVNAEAGPSRLRGMAIAIDTSLPTTATHSEGTIYPDESPLSALTDGFSTARQYGASASSPGAGSESEGHTADYFVSLNGEETEVEAARRRARMARVGSIAMGKKLPGSRSGSGDGEGSDRTRAAVTIRKAVGESHAGQTGQGSSEAGHLVM